MSIYLINEFLNTDNPSVEDVENAKFHAEAGNIEAQYHLAIMYDCGKGVLRNPREAERWYKEASKAGHAGAKYYLGKMYSTQNSGIRCDKNEAQRLFREAAQAGHFDAMIELS